MSPSDRRSPGIERRNSPVLDRLRGGDRRSIGRVPHVVREVSRNPELAGELVSGLLAGDPVIRMRAADALEKASRERPAMLDPFKEILLRAAESSGQQEVRWHLAQMLPRLKLARKERDGAVRVLRGYLEDPSSIVKVCAMTALAELAANDRRLAASVKPLIDHACRDGTPAMRSRGRKLLSLLKQ